MMGRSERGPRVRLACGCYGTDPTTPCHRCAVGNPADRLFDRPERAEPLNGVTPLGGMCGTSGNWHTPYDRR